MDNENVMAAAASGAAGKKFKVSVSKTAAQAAAVSGDDLGALCFPTDDKHAVYIGGDRYGLSATEADYLTRKMEEEIKAKCRVELTLSPAGPLNPDMDADKVITITVKTYYDGALTDADSLPAKNGSGFTLTEAFAKTATGTYVGKSTISATTSFGVKVTMKGFDLTASKTVQYFHLIRFGVSAKATLEAADLASLSTRGPQASAAGTYDFNFTANPQYGYIAIPAGVTIPASLNQAQPQGIEGPLPVLMTKQGEVQAAPGGRNTTTFTVYRFADAQGVSTHSVKFS